MGGLGGRAPARVLAVLAMAGAAAFGAGATIATGQDTERVRIMGTAGNDTIEGTDAAEIIDALEGDDRVAAAGGSDEVNGGSGDDTLAAGAGDDAVFGGSGSDTVSGDDGADEVSGGGDDDVVDGGAGSDVVDGGSGDDTIAARDGVSDEIVCGSGNDVVETELADAIDESCEDRRYGPEDQALLKSLKPGRSFGVVAGRGQVRVLIGRRSVDLADLDGGVPFGAVLVPRSASQELLVVVLRKDGSTAAVRVSSTAPFKITDNGRLTVLTLNPATKKKARRRKAGSRKATSAARKRPPRIKVRGKGRFKVKGRFSSATVRGTDFGVEDLKAGTITRVREGVVSVRDEVKRKTVVLRAGQSYLAKPKPARKRKRG